METAKYGMVEIMKYIEWFKDNWNLTGGLITQAQASKMLEKTPTRIRQMIHEGKLTAYVYEHETPLVSFSEVLKLKSLKEHKTDK